VRDTLVAVGDVTADGSVILAKNSDREPHEAHVLTQVPRAWHKAGSAVECTDSRRADEATGRWARPVSKAPIEHSPSILFRAAWRRVHRQADFRQQEHA
jgi:dipeptidase